MKRIIINNTGDMDKQHHLSFVEFGFEYNYNETINQKKAENKWSFSLMAMS